MSVLRDPFAPSPAGTGEVGESPNRERAPKLTLVDPFASDPPRPAPEGEGAGGEGSDSARPTPDRGTYLWNGTAYPRVTDILGTAPGRHLMSWYAKQAALKAASSLVMAGMHAPDPMGELESFVQAQAMREVTPAEAVAEACDWVDVMKEPERYRDSKARIGSVTHHALYERALGVTVEGSALGPYLCGLARKVLGNPEYAGWRERMAALGKEDQDLETTLAYAAAPYVERAFAWTDDYLPEWEATGQEAMVVSEREGYAGTCDGIAVFRREVWERHRPWPFGDLKTARLVCDFKTSTSLATSARFQLSAYAYADFIALPHDGSEHEIGELDGGFLLHVRKDSPSAMQVWTAPDLEKFYDGFIGLCAYVRCLGDMPKPARSRREAKPRPLKRTERVEVDF